MILAAVSRWHGSDLQPSKVFKSIAWGIPFALAVWFLGGGYILPFLCLGLCALGKSTGHGAWFDLGTWKGPDRKARLDFLINWLSPHLSIYWYEALGLAIVGLAAVSGAVVSFLFINPVFSAIIALCGVLKALAYMIGWKLFPKNQWSGATVTGEILTGLWCDVGLLLLVGYA